MNPKQFFFLVGLFLLVVGSVTCAHAQTSKRPDTPPRYKGGQAKLTAEIHHHLNYPEKARQKGITGSVLVGFVVEPDGRVTQVQVLDSLGGGCDEEAVRVVGLLTDWLPGRNQHKPVPVQVQLPIPFGETTHLQIQTEGGAQKKGNLPQRNGDTGGSLWHLLLNILFLYWLITNGYLLGQNEPTFLVHCGLALKQIANG